MKNYFIVISLILTTTFISCKEQKESNPTMQAMAERLMPDYANQFFFEQIHDSISGDFFEIESINNKIVIRGNNTNSMAVGLNHYLKYYCMATISWFLDDPIELPEQLPQIPQKEKITARVNNRFFLNYCTFGYTMPWWQWKDWERLIDWMALNGVNMPLATTGQEAVWYEVWYKMGLTDSEIRNYFTGPAHLPWHRMSNIDYWQGPLPKEWLENQKELQKKIVSRERELGMKPVLPAFAGHVPQELKRIFPKAKISKMTEWGGFPEEYKSSFLHPDDSLFAVIQKEFLEEQTKLFGTDHIYGVDPFNEVDPPSWELDSLAASSAHILKTIEAVDPKAQWLQMTWLFYYANQKWTNPRIKAYLTAVPKEKMILLDYFCENTEVWKSTESYFGQPYLWCYLGNFGGNTMLAGNIKEVGERIENVIKNGGANFSGLGSTLEALDVNPFMYEYVFEKAWNHNKADSIWIQQLANRRIGKVDKHAHKAWKTLYDNIYIESANVGQGTMTNARPTLTGHNSWTTTPTIKYNNKDLAIVWETLLEIDNCSRDSYKFDIVNIGRQVLGNYFWQIRDEFTKAYNNKDLKLLQIKAKEMEETLEDMDRLLSHHPTFSLHKWIGSARELGHDDNTKKYYEQNARNIITTWGGKDIVLNDYANRSWSGLISTYYAPRWKLFANSVIEAVKNGKQFDDKKFHKKIIEFEYNWFKSTDPIITNNIDEKAIDLARTLQQKYKLKIK